jgi:26S proteasome regulatory subunit T1
MPSLWASKVSQPLFRRYRSVSVADPQINELLTHHAAHPSHSLNLSTLLSFGRPPTPDSVLQSVSYVLSEIPRRLATRVRSFEALPFIVGTNPYVAKTLHAYRESFKRLVSYPPVHNADDNTEFAACLEVLVQNHANDIPTLAKGYEFSTQSLKYLRFCAGFRNALGT